MTICTHCQIAEFKNEYGEDNIMIHATTDQHKKVLTNVYRQVSRGTYRVLGLFINKAGEQIKCICRQPETPAVTQPLGSRVSVKAEALEWFAGIMEEKLSENDHKPNWRGEKFGYLFKRLLDEVNELEEAVSWITARLGLEGEATHINVAIRECADVANFAMMIADRLRGMSEK